MSVTARIAALLVLQVLSYARVGSAWVVSVPALARRPSSSSSIYSNSNILLPKTATEAREKATMMFAKKKTKKKKKNGFDTATSKTSSTSSILGPSVDAVASSGLDHDEFSLLMDVLSFECGELGVSCTTTGTGSTSSDSKSTGQASSRVVPAPIIESASVIPGALGRVLLVRASADMPLDVLEELEAGICEQMDKLLSDEMLSEALLVSFQKTTAVTTTTTTTRPSQQQQQSLQFTATEEDEKDDYAQYLASIVANAVQEYGMLVPLEQQTPQALAKKNQEEEEEEDASFVPSMHVEIDGGYISSPFDGDDDDDDDDDEAPPPFWDTSTLLIFDNLVNGNLRKDLLDVVLGTDSDEHDPKNGPDPSRWLRGRLLDVPDEDDNDDDGEELVVDEEIKIESDDSESDTSGGGWGLTDESLDEICFEQHDAVQEMESILANLFPHFHVCRLPEIVLGSSVTPMTANAPTAGDVFDYHIDADPNMTPSSPWTDVFGRYPNRSIGKPRFMSCLVYLNEEWDAEEWGAPTIFADVPTDEDLTVYTVKPRPGRCIIMDQDIGHSVVAPNAAAGKRPRYSVVWKLILHPKVIGQNMKNLAGGRESLWPETEYFGSAAQNFDGQSQKEPASSLKEH